MYVPSEANLVILRLGSFNLRITLAEPEPSFGAFLMTPHPLSQFSQKICESETPKYP
jgi:hypothetical protein